MSSPPNSACVEACALDEVRDGRSLVCGDRRPDLQHQAPPVREQALRLRGLGHALERGVGGVLVGGAAVVKRPDRVLVLEPHAQRAQLGRESRLRRRRARAPARSRAAGRAGFRGARLQHLEAVVADVDELLDAHDLARDRCAAAGQARDEREALSEPAQHLAARGHGGVLGPGDDRSERPVDVAHDGGRLGAAPAAVPGAARVPRSRPSRALVSPTVSRADLAKLAVIGTAAGAFSGLFGVGGGTIIVPLLVLWFGYGEHEATGTSLAAIIVIAAFGVAFHGAYGNVDVGKGLLVGVPAVAGVVIGTGLQQRLSGRTLLLMFAALLVVVAVDLLGGWTS